MIQLIHGDQRRYLQILLNFLSNSLKFTNKGGNVTVAVSVLDYQLRRSIQKKDKKQMISYNKVLSQIKSSKKLNN